MEFLFKKGVTAFVALMVLVTTQLSFAEDGPDRAAEMGARTCLHVHCVRWA